MIDFYCHPRCSTCKKAERWLAENNVEYNWIDLTQETPDRDLILKSLQEANRTRKSFFNTSGNAYREMGLKDKLDDLSTEEAADLLASDGMLIKRPFTTDGKTVTSGFKAEEFEKVWKEKAHMVMKFHENGLYVKKEDDQYTIGLSDKGQDDVGDVMFADMPQFEESLTKGDTILGVEGAKAVTDFTAPFDAKVLEVNEAIEDDPELLNEADNWILKVSEVDSQAFDALKDKAWPEEE